MSVQTKKRFKNLGKTIGIALFALLMFTNIKVALMGDAELASGDISVFGIELNLFVPSYAETTGSNDYDWTFRTSTCVPTPEGDLCDWICNLPSTPHCTYGDTGQGYR